MARSPATWMQLTALAGVGRKTANVVLGTAFGIATGIVVDTHVKRLAKRLGLTSKKTPEQIERDLMQVVPRSQWVDLSHRLIQHGRRVCLARSPRCDDCSLASICPKVGVSVDQEARDRGPLEDAAVSLFAIGARRRDRDPQSSARRTSLVW